jgi:kynurenine formamidase
MLRLVDLSFDIYDKQPTFGMDPKTAVIEHLKLKDLSYNITQLVMSTHISTHLDAPFHFFDDGLTVDQLDVRRGFGPAWVLDFTRKKPKEEITVKDLEPFESKIVKGSRVLIRTGWDKEFPADRYFGEMPYLSVDACKWLAGRGILCVAMDFPSINGVEYIPAHRALLNQNNQVLIVEALRGLERLQGEQVIFIALPLRVRGRDGSPCRAMALDGDIQPLVKLFDGLEFDVKY